MARRPASVLSDDKIVEKLKSDGIEIARRTVAKYREAMRIPSSVQRRRDKRLIERVGSRRSGRDLPQAGLPAPPDCSIGSRVARRAMPQGRPRTSSFFKFRG